VNTKKSHEQTTVYKWTYFLLPWQGSAAWHAARRAYRDLRRQKRESFWLEKVDSERSSPVQLWRSVDALMGRGRLTTSDAIGPNELHSFFDAKVAAVHAATDLQLMAK
jgi:hypothetical protein